MMRTIRLAALFVLGVLFVLNPKLVRADPTECCSRFQQQCESWCVENGHGHELITQCGGWQCLETCFCTGTCGGLQCEYTEPGGTYCAPCAVP
jgi:hypothetical protein